jgi:putative transcriptional regulator
MVKMKLHMLLDIHRISQRELSIKTGIRFGTINKYTNNSYKYISNEHIDILCKFFNIKIEELIEYIRDSD